MQSIDSVLADIDAALRPAPPRSLPPPLPSRAQIGPCAAFCAFVAQTHPTATQLSIVSTLPRADRGFGHQHLDVFIEPALIGEVAGALEKAASQLRQLAGEARQ